MIRGQLTALTMCVRGQVRLDEADIPTAPSVLAAAAANLAHMQEQVFCACHVRAPAPPRVPLLRVRGECEWVRSVCVHTGFQAAVVARNRQVARAVVRRASTFITNAADVACTSYAYVACLMRVRSVCVC